MNRIRIIILLFAALALLAGWQIAFSGDDSGNADVVGTENRMVTFKGRQIDLKPYVDGFPYYGFRPSFDAGKLFYFYRGESTELRSIDLAGSPNLAEGRRISNIDFSTRNVWGIFYNKADQQLYWIGDEVNDEIINLYRLNPESGKIDRLTDVPYIFGWKWNKNKDKVAYVARLGDKEKRLGELRLLDLRSGKEQAIMQDNPEFRFTWSSPSWRPDGSGVVTSVLKDANRLYGNLVYVDLKSKTWKMLTDPAAARSYPSAAEKWLSNDEFIYFSNEDGFTNIYSYNIATMKGRQLTFFKKDLSSKSMVTVDGKQRMLVVLSNPIESELLLLNPSDGKILFRQNSAVNISLLDEQENRLLAATNSASSMFSLEEMTVSASEVKSENRIDVPRELKEKVMHARVERIEFPTFDIDPKTGKQRMLHAFLYHPDNPLPENERMVMIQSFYGGSNRFSTRTQILAEAGIYVLSPSPRGSFGFGRDFMALNDKDLGGNEIIDIIYAAKFIGQKLNISNSRIGVYGGSHGGYATMRLLTFPGEINGNKAAFNWGFGISHAGFSDIIHFYENCNIPDWVTLEAGDPVSEAAKLRDRSPLYHADKMVGKLLLTHGSNDSRVPIEGSLWMADSLRKYSKNVTMVTFEGQGHSIKGLENSVRNYRTWFEFLDTVQ